MCNPVAAMAAGTALSTMSEYKKADAEERNRVRMQEAKNNAFKSGMDRQKVYINEGQNLFNNQLENTSADNFNNKLAIAADERLKAFNDNRLDAPVSDYQFDSTPKNVLIAQNKAFNDKNDIFQRDATNLANLTSYDDAMFNTDLERSNYGRNFANLADRASRDMNLVNMDMNSAAFNAYKPIDPLWSILGGAGKAGSMVGAYQAPEYNQRQKYNQR
jgi:hypothetical protein